MQLQALQHMIVCGQAANELQKEIHSADGNQARGRVWNSDWSLCTVHVARCGQHDTQHLRQKGGLLPMANAGQERSPWSSAPWTSCPC